MDATSAAIVVFVVITIFSSFGGNKGYHQPGYRTESNQGASQVTASAKIPLGYQPDQLRPIANFITSFRKPDEAVEIAKAIDTHAKTYDVNPKLVAALIRRESGFNPRALSKSGAMGLGQLLPSTCQTTGVTNGYDIDDNAKGTVRYVKYLLDKFRSYDEPVKFALAGYLEGPNGVERKRGYTSTTARYVNDILLVYQKI